ncbi:peptide ABC transporter substrate-binding protein [Tumebacillus permanentifrigoris]|uniref:Oligopeptide transport system substrate-binding protein n=1 Tax=Tumebacillus permanentifrigoris TaxID=378543 RepID=A0A316DBN0_9BACL|nr:peptide ABC transporter substrate-binding protein [Tumebacillus permanentifrigoris]PWK15601.1 oligopeptide transport system substrate-binding protein [Tumebacillus permanentifrigoris]
MKTKKWLGIGLAVTMLSSVALAGCGNSTDSASGDSKGNDEQVINLALSDEVPTLDVSKATDNLAFRMLGQVNEGLTRLDKDGKAAPGVAKDWKVSADGLTYTFNLRDDAKWSDGSAVTAKDFEYSWKRTLDPKTASQYAFMVGWVKGGNAFNSGKGSVDEVGVKAKDDKTLEVTLDKPVPFFAEQMSFPLFFPQKKEYVEAQGTKYGADADKVLSNGPFKMTEWVHEQSATLVKNDNYWDKANVKLEKVNYQVVKDSGALENLYQAGQLDRIGLVRDQVDRYKGTPEYVVIPELTNGYIQYNEKVKALTSPKVRKALTYAIDGDQYADIVYHNGTAGATGFVPTGTSNGNGGDFRKDNGDLLKRKENTAKAKDLLAEGLKEVGLTELPKIKLLSDDGDVSKKASEFLKEQWRQNLGVDIEVENVPFKLRLQRTTARDYDMVVSLWGADYNDPMTFLDMWITDGDFNENGYSNSKYDELISSAQKEADSKKRMQYLYDAEKLLMEDMPVGPIFFRASSGVSRPYVKGWQTSMSAPDYDLKGVYIEGKSNK